VQTGLTQNKKQTEHIKKRKGTEQGSKKIKQISIKRKRRIRAEKKPN
jgi:hypothetical protein